MTKVKVKLEKVQQVFEFDTPKRAAEFLNSKDFNTLFNILEYAEEEGYRLSETKTIMDFFYFHTDKIREIMNK